MNNDALIAELMSFANVDSTTAASILESLQWNLRLALSILYGDSNRPTPISPPKDRIVLSGSNERILKARDDATAKNK
jgi:hypothetical protein